MAMGQGIGAIYILAQMKQTALAVIQCGSNTTISGDQAVAVHTTSWP